MSIEKVVLIYSAILGVLFALVIWMFIRNRAAKRRNAPVLDDLKVEAPPRQAIDWGAAVSKLRPDKVLTGEMWARASIAAFVALCAGVIVVVYIFPLGAAWAAGASFAAAVLLVGLLVILLD